MRRRGNRAVWPGERGDEELHEIVQHRPGHRRAPSTQIPDAGLVGHLRSRMGAKGGVIISDARITSLSKFRASRVLTYPLRVAVIKKLTT